MILKDGIITRFNNTCMPRSISQLAIVASQFITQKEPFFFFARQTIVLIHLLYLCNPRLNGKISLSIGHNLFAWISILYNQITSITG